MDIIGNQNNMSQITQAKRKRSKRKVITILSVAIAIIIVAAAGVYLKMRGEQQQMNALQTGEFMPGIYAINCGFVNMFLIESGGSYIAVDAGGSANAVEQGLSDLGISGDDVAYVLMTHTHGDHTAGIGLFDKAIVYGVNVSASTQIVSDGDTFTLNGKSIQVIATPGHADDSVCYLINGDTLFAGDNLSLKNGSVELFNSVFNKSDEQQKADIDRLAGLDGVRYIVTAHYGYTERPVFP